MAAEGARHEFCVRALAGSYLVEKETKCTYLGGLVKSLLWYKMHLLVHRVTLDWTGKSERGIVSCLVAA